MNKLSVKNIIAIGNDEYDFGNEIIAKYQDGWIAFYLKDELMNAYRGGSISFGNPLTEDDKEYLAHLGNKALEYN